MDKQYLLNKISAIQEQLLKIARVAKSDRIFNSLDESLMLCNEINEEILGLRKDKDEKTNSNS